MHSNNSDAKQAYIDAFERLKIDKPVRVGKGTPITQNNVAREAGRDPSALKKKYYPGVILAIQSYIQSRNELLDSKKNVKDNRNRTKNERLKDYKNQLNRLCSIVAAQNIEIRKLLITIEHLTNNKVKQIGQIKNKY